VQAVLFDLDGTLLDLDLSAFLARYFAALETAAAPLLNGTGIGGPAFMGMLRSAVGTMMEPHPGRTNREVFNERLRDLSGVDLDHDWTVFETFYSDVFPALRDTARPAQGARDAVETALGLGLRVAIATNPIFPESAIRHRLSWAGLGDLELSVVTAYEYMRACKPHGEYFLQTADLLGVAPCDCMMVGDDRALDLPAADVGMRTFYVGKDPDATADMMGTLAELTRLLPRLV